MVQIYDLIFLSSVVLFVSEERQNIEVKNMLDFMKKTNDGSEVMSLTADELIAKVTKDNKKVLLLPAVGVVAILLLATSFIAFNPVGIENSENGFISFANTSAAAGSKKNLISIPSGTVKANPFLPYRNIDGKNAGSNKLPAFELIAPPEVISEDSEAARVMDTIVSGILYDKYSPSAILNIEGNDYLVKKGDVVINYKVLDIAKDSVTVKLGSNTYKAGIGEILTEGSVNINDVSNLGKKFGGERK